MNISLQVKKIYYKPLNNTKCLCNNLFLFYNGVLSLSKTVENTLCALIIISKVTVSVSKYETLNNIKYLCDNFLQCRLEFVNRLRIHYVLAGVRSRFDIINRSQCYSHICQNVRLRQSENFKLILKDVKHSR